MPRFVNAPSVGLIAAVIGGLLVPFMIVDPVWMDVAVITLIHYCAALGLVVLFGYAGQISLAQAAFYGIGAYAPAILTIQFELTAWWGLLAGVGISLAVAFLIGGVVLRLEGLYLAMATAAFNIIFVVVVTTWRTVTGGGFGISGIPALTFGSWEFYEPNDFYLVALAFALFLTFITQRLIKSPVGMIFAAIGHDQRAAALIGVPVPAIKVRAFMLSAAYAAVGGFLLVQYMAVAVPDSFSVAESIGFLLMVVIGGLRSPLGALLGALFVTLIPQLLPDSPQMQEVVYALTFMVVLMFLPKGLVGLVPSRRIGRRTRSHDHVEPTQEGVPA